MRIRTLSFSLALLAACSKGEPDAAATGAAVDTQPPPAATVSLADIAGRWDVTSTPESGSDMTPNRYTLTATSDMTGWSITVPNRPEPVPLRVVSVDGDSATVIAATTGTVANKASQGEPVPRRFRVQLTLELVDGEWLTSNLEFVG